MIEPRYITKYYFTVEELISNYTDIWGDEDFTNMFYEFFPNAPIYEGTETVALKPYLREVLRFTFSRYALHYGLITTHKTYTNDEYSLFIIGLINVIVGTYDRYAPLMKLYEDNKDDLLKQISATTSSKIGYNDTPQEGGAWEDEGHRTNFTESTTENSVDGDTLINRLDQINAKLHSILMKWSNEFDKLFIEEESI